MVKMIDAHIHLDQYKEKEICLLMETIPQIDGLIAVSTNLESCKRNLELAKKYQKVRPAFGYHPEQQLPTEEQQNKMISWMEHHIDDMIAIGEVGLPYYLRRKEEVSDCQVEQDIELVHYKEKIQQLVHQYPLEQMMIETDGPWPFEGPFLGRMTHPNMMIQSIKAIAKIKKWSVEEVSERLWKNTKLFYQL